MDEVKDRKHPVFWLLLVTALVGIVAGLLLAGRSSESGPVVTMEAVADLIRDVLRGQTAGPIVASALTAAAAIVSAAVIPAVVVIVLAGLQRRNNKQKETQHGSGN